MGGSLERISARVLEGAGVEDEADCASAREMNQSRSFRFPVRAIDVRECEVDVDGRHTVDDLGILAGGVSFWSVRWVSVLYQLARSCGFSSCSMFCTDSGELMIIFPHSS